MRIGNLREMIGRAVGAVPAPETEPDPDKAILIPNRRELRRSRRSHYAPVGKRRYDKPRSRTGSPDWFRSMKVRAAIKEQLSRIRLADTGMRDTHVLGLAEIGVTNVWQLSQADRAELLKAKGIGPKALRDLRAMMVKQNVPVAWKAEA